MGKSKNGIMTNYETRMRNVRMGAAAGLSYPALHCVKAQPKGGEGC